MQVHELADVGRFLRDFIRDRDLRRSYKELISAVNQAAQNQNPQEVQASLDRLLALHEEAEKQVLSPAQAKLLADYGGTKVLGREATARITAIFDQHRGHPQGIVEALQAMLQDTSEFASRAEQLVAALEPMLVGDEEQPLGQDEGRLWLYFAEAASVDTIDDLEKAAETWKQILHHFARLPNVGPTPGRLLQIAKRSPLELEIAASIALLVPLAAGIQWVLSRIEHVIRILQEAEKLKQLKVKTKTIKALQDEAEEARAAIASEAADDIKARFGGDNETRNAIEQGLAKIIAFVENGGQLDIDLPPTNEETSTPEQEAPRAREQLRAIVDRIRKDIRLLPPPSGNDAGDDQPDSAS